MAGQRKHRRLALRLCAGLLLAWSAALAYGWFYALAPGRHVMDPAWVRQHSAQARWAETQAQVRRGGWWHDTGLEFGLYADKGWAQWIMAHVVPGASMDCMGTPCHSSAAMRDITNQDAGDGADGWLAWWAANGSKPQEEWIRDGFTNCGVTVHLPPEPADTESLLGLLGRAGTNAPEAVPWHVKYNAYRWLRDSGFSPVGYAVTNLTEHSPGVLRAGLVSYARLGESYPRRDGVGLLNLGLREEDPSAGLPLPNALRPRFRLAVYALMAAPLLVALGLLRRSRSTAGRSGSRAAPGAGGDGAPGTTG
jgi:hypothetical protein